MAVSHHGTMGYVYHVAFLVIYLWQAGISTIGMGLVTNFGGLVAMRILLGLSEAGLFPGARYILYT
jgi:MFS family permease